MPEIPQPHDNLIRFTLKSTDNAASLFQAHLPPTLVEVLEWKQLRTENTSFVSPELRRSESDLLFSIPVRQTTPGVNASEVLLYLLFEHQRSSDRWLPLRLLGYMHKIWELWRRKQPAAEGLPVIIPLVLSQVEGGWRVSPQFADLLTWPEAPRETLEKYQPRFEHLLIDLARATPDQLQGTPEVRLAQSVMKAVMEEQLEDWIDGALPWMPGVPPEFLRVLLLYVANASSNLDFHQLITKIKSANIPNANDAIMSIAEQLRTEGREEGLIRGREEGLTRGALVGEIRALQRVLKRPESNPAELIDLDANQLQAMIAQLNRELASR